MQNTAQITRISPTPITHLSCLPSSKAQIKAPRRDFLPVSMGLGWHTNMGQNKEPGNDGNQWSISLLPPPWPYPRNRSWMWTHPWDATCQMRTREVRGAREGQWRETRERGPAASEMAWLELWQHRVLGKQAHTFRRSRVGSCNCVSVFIGQKQQNTWRTSIGERSFCPVVLTLSFCNTVQNLITGNCFFSQLETFWMYKYWIFS